MFQPRAHEPAVGRHRRRVRRMRARSSARRRSRGSTSTAAGAPAASRRRRVRAGCSRTRSRTIEPHALNARVLARAFLHRAPDRRARRRRRRALSDSLRIRTMLLIECPWCGPRDKPNFPAAARRTSSRPARHRYADRRAVGRLPVHAQEPARRASRAMGAHVRLPALVQRGARHRDVPDQRPSTRPAESRAEGATAMTAGSTDLRTGGRIDRAQPLAFTFNGKHYVRATRATRSRRRCSPTASHVVARSWKYHRPRGIVGAAWRSRTRSCSSKPARARCRMRARPKSSSTRG